MAKTDVTLPNDSEPTPDQKALATVLDCKKSLQHFVSLDHPILLECHGEAFKLLGRMSRAINRLAFQVNKKKG